ncbi:uncharacterized protein LOC115421873 isoform X2 [Sphaeramia orbicularis]|uniref:uncharacterized protein LOC115421873 isoform X2 n=1 Tax=Sphaeramia orbicularis TaxID=375764 RepID=UPI001180938E|nr:uncharacterized protein LOC115421873 isoform X2 [Sphaeramia orbicularis]
MNYVVTLLLSYEEDSPATNIDISELRGILKPPRPYRMDFNSDLEDERDKKDEAGTSQAGLVRPTAICPLLIQPDIDVEIAVHPSGLSVPPNQELPSVDGTQSAHTVSALFPSMSSSTPLQTTLPSVLCTNESVQSNKSEPSPGVRCVLGSQTSEQPKDSSPFALLPATVPSISPESRLRSDSSPAGEEEISSLETPRKRCPTTETNLWPTGEYGSTQSPAGRPCLELPAECVSALSVTQSSEPEVAVGLSELVAGLSEGSTRSAAHYEGSVPVLLSPVAESQGAEGEAPPSLEPAENDSLSTGVSEVKENLALHSASAREERQDAPQISPDTLLENLPSTLSEHDVNVNLMPSIIFLSGVVSLSVMLQEPSALLIIGLFLVLCRL